MTGQYLGRLPLERELRRSREDRGGSSRRLSGMERLMRWIIGAFITLAITLGVAAPAQAYPTMPPEVQGPFTVTKVVDGDTIWVDNNGKRQKIRMIGMDAPESVDPRKPVQCFGLEASAQAKTILGGQSVYLETDPSQDAVDKYGRTLAYVWTSSGRLFNLAMIVNGYAHEYTYDLPYRYQQDFKAAEDDARTHERGLWSPNACVA